MQTVPQRQVMTQKVANTLGEAVSVDGAKSALTTDVFNTITGEKEIALTIANTGGAAANNIIIFPGSWQTSAMRALPAGVTIDVDDFASFDSFLAYFQHTSTAISKLVMQTDDVTNYDNEFLLTSKDPAGQETIIKVKIDKYKANLGVGWSSRLEMPFKYMVSHLLSLSLKTLKAGTEVKIYMSIGGVNKVEKLSPMSSSMI